MVEGFNVILIKNSKGVSLIEGFLAGIIFIIAVTAIFSSLNAMRKPAVNNEKATEAALVLSNFLDDIRAKVSAADADGTLGAYADGGVLDEGQNRGPITRGSYNIFYNVYVDGTGARKVDANIIWDDAI
jgi:Tfp pilus assembly protein PilV